MVLRHLPVTLDIATRSPFNFTVLSNDPVLVEALTTKIKDKVGRVQTFKFRVDGASGAFACGCATTYR